MPLTSSYVHQIFEPLTQGDWETFLSHVKDDVSWTVANPNLKTFPVAGVYDKKGFIAAFTPLNECFASPLALSVQNLWLAEPATAVVELRAQSKGKKNGATFDNFYCWVCEFDDGSKPQIKVVRAYLDSALVKDTMANNS